MKRPSAAHFAMILALAYPPLAHWSIAERSVPLAVTAIAVLALAMLLPGLVERRWGAIVLTALTAGACWMLARAEIPELPLYAPPMLFDAFMAWVFGRTLRRGRTPLIAQMIEIMHRDLNPPPEPAVWVYARSLTAAWTTLFAALAATNLVLALLARPDGLLIAVGVVPPLSVAQETWSVFANVVEYLLIAAFFVVEYAWRRHRFPHQPYRNIFDFFRRITAAMPELMRRQS